MSVTPTLPKINIKRVKLVVRRPPPPLTNPRQRPPPALYNSSLPAYLSSYQTIDDEDVDASTVEQNATADATTLERVNLFRSQGRFIPGTDVLFGTTAPTAAAFPTPQRSQDTWDHVVEAVAAQWKQRKKKSTGVQIAAQIGRMVQAYWDGQAARQDKAKAQEERRLRMLAKATIKLVTNEWKKAVFVCCLVFFAGVLLIEVFVSVAYKGTGKTKIGGGRGETRS